MIHFKSRVITFSLILCFLVSIGARKTNRDVSQIGYSYEKPGKPLEIPKNIKEPEEEMSTEEINPTKTPVETTSGDEYLPPKTISLGQPSGGEDESSKQIDDKKKESPKIKRKSAKEDELFLHEEGSEITSAERMLCSDIKSLQEVLAVLESRLKRLDDMKQ